MIGTANVSSDLESILAFLRRRLPSLMESGENWKLTLHGGKGGDVRFETGDTGEIVPARKNRTLEERRWPLEERQR